MVVFCKNKMPVSTCLVGYLVAFQQCIQMWHNIENCQPFNNSKVCFDFAIELQASSVKSKKCSIAFKTEIKCKAKSECWNTFNVKQFVANLCNIFVPFNATQFMQISPSKTFKAFVIMTNEHVKLFVSAHLHL